MTEKIALVTGASRGLGKAIAETLVQESYFVYSGVRDIQKAPKGTTGIYLNLTDEKSLEACVHSIINEKGRLDVLIHNAAVAYWGAVDSMTLSEARHLFEVNFFGIFRLTQLFLPFMREKRFGRILFVSSIRGVESCAYMGMYSASKAALEAMAFDWAVTLQKWNIFVSVVQPGPLDTGIDIQHGNYFQPAESNPYLPYGDVSLIHQSAQEASEVILEQLRNPCPPFRFQTNANSKDIIARHLVDPSGMQWHEEQKEWVNSSKAP